MYWTNIYKNSEGQARQIGWYESENIALAVYYDEWCNGGDFAEWTYVDTVFISK